MASVRARGGLIDSRSQLIRGVVYGLLAMAFTAYGIILAKPLMDGGTASVPVVQVALVRLFAGLMGSVVFLALSGV